MNRTILLGLGGLAVAATYLWGASSIRDTAFGDPLGASGLPSILGWGLVVLSVLNIVQGTLVGDAPSARDAEADVFDRPALAWLRGIGVVAIGFLYILVVPWMGYPVATALTIGATALYFGASPDWRLPVIMVAGGTAMWLIFVLAMRVRMPAGVWPGLFGWN